MMLDMTPRRVTAVLATGILTLLAPVAAYSQVAEADPAYALLDQVKKSDLDRQVANKQMEIDRLKQDQSRAEQDTSKLETSAESTTKLLEASTENLTTLSAEPKKLEHQAAIAGAKITAERQKIEGLKALQAAQAKSLSALKLHLDEAEARTRVRTAELELLQGGQVVPTEGNEEKAQGDLARARKALALAQSKTQFEERAAREAMKSASAKLAQAEARDAAVKKLADMDAANPAPVAEKTMKPKSASRESAEPAPRKMAAPAPVSAKPTVSAAASKPAPAATPKPTAAPGRSLFPR